MAESLLDKFARIIALGLDQKEGLWHDFLTKGLYDPRLLSIHIKTFYGMFADCKRDYIVEHDLDISYLSKYDFIDYDNVEMLDKTLQNENVRYVGNALSKPFKPKCFCYILQIVPEREEFLSLFELRDIYDFITEQDQRTYLKQKPFEIIEIIRWFGIPPVKVSAIGPIKDLGEFGLDHPEIILNPKIRPYFTTVLPGICRLAAYNDEYFTLERRLIDLFYEPDGKEFKEFQEEIKCPDNDELLQEGRTLEFLTKYMTKTKRSYDSYLEIEYGDRIEYMKLVGELINNFCWWYFRDVDRQLPMGEYLNTTFRFHSCLFKLPSDHIPKLFQLTHSGLVISKQRYYTQNLKIPYGNFYVPDNCLTENLEIQRLRQSGRTDLLFKFSREFCLWQVSKYLTVDMLKCIIKDYKFRLSDNRDYIHKFIRFGRFDLAEYLIDTFKIEFVAWTRELVIPTKKEYAEGECIYEKTIQFLKKHFDGSKPLECYDSRTFKIIAELFENQKYPEMVRKARILQLSDLAKKFE